MSDRMRITGMNSGMDTETIVQQLVLAKKVKVDNLKNDQKKLEWKQTAWQDLNSKIYNLYSSTLSKLRLTGAYKKKTTTISDPTKATVTADGTAVDGTHTLSIEKLAKASYLTGAKISKEAKSLTHDSNMSDIDPSVVGKKITLTDKNDSSIETEITIDSNMKISGFVEKLKGNRYTASFDNTARKFAIGDLNSKFTMKTTDSSAFAALGFKQDDASGNLELDSNVALDAKYTSGSKLSDINNDMVGKEITLTDIQAGGTFTKTIKITKDMTLSQFADEIKSARYVASFDEQNQRFEIRDEKSAFTISDKDGNGNAANGSVLSKLGISASNFIVDGGWIKGSSIGQEAATYTASSKLSKLDSELFKGKEVIVGAGTEADPQKKQVKYTELVVKAGTGAKQKETKIELKEDMTISDLLTKLKDAGVNASFDETNQRFFISAKDTGAENDFTITAVNPYESDKAEKSLEKLGLYYGDGNVENKANKITGEDSKITLDGVEYTSTRNAYSINGLTINATGTTVTGTGASAIDSPITIMTSTDYKGAYDTIKEFLSEYNDLINEIDKSYNADSARKYKMLSEDQKDAMSDEEVEKWEGTIKGALLRKDTQLRTIMDVLTRSMNESLYVNGKKSHLSDYGIKTLDYFKAKDNEHYAYHIDGDADDEHVSGEKDKLMKALMADPDGTIQFFADLSKNVYNKVGEIMNKTSEYSSIYKVYNDKQLKKDYDNYSKKIKDAEDKLSAYEDKWYDKFAKMEKALAKLQSNQSTVSGMLGK